MNTTVQGDGRVKVVVATTVLLSFISFWRAAAIVLSDLGSTAFYVGGIVEEAIGRSAPWFVLGVMLFSYAVRALTFESAAIFVRAGVYRVVKEAMGGMAAKLAVSALLFDYVLTGPISGVSAGRYVAGLINDLLLRSGSSFHLNEGVTAVVVAITITLYFWRRNTRGLHESSEDALTILKVTVVMVVVLVLWCLLTLLQKGGTPVPLPTLENLEFSTDALGWLNGTIWPTFTAVAIFVGFGHSILAMSGEESLAQVYREIEQPKTKNLQRAGLVIFIVSLVFTGLVGFFAVSIIPDDVRPQYFENLISGLAMHLVGPESLKLLFQAFVVVVGCLLLAGAANTSLVGSNGVLNRVSEDGVLTEWFRKPHKRFGTTYRLINLVIVLQLITIVLSGGDVYVLGEAYAFGVVWSFAFNAVSVLILRYKRPDAPRDWRVPFNFKIGGVEIPLGLITIAGILLCSALVNLVTKQVATISGIIFTGAFFATFLVSERLNARKRSQDKGLDQFQLAAEAEIGVEAMDVRPGGVLVPVRDYNTLKHLDWVLGQPESEDRDVVVLTIRLLRQGQGTQGLDEEQLLFSDYEQTLFTRVVAIAERQGRNVRLLVAPGSNIFDALAQAAVQLESGLIVVGESEVMPPEQQAHLLGEAWDRTPHDRKLSTRFVVLRTDGKTVLRFSLGAHAPDLSPEDVERIHLLWVEAVKAVGPNIHHRDIVAAALGSLEEELTNASKRPEAVNRLRRHLDVKPPAS